MEIKEAIKILERRNEWIVPNSDMDEAIETILKYFEGEYKNGT